MMALRKIGALGKIRHRGKRTWGKKHGPGKRIGEKGQYYLNVNRYFIGKKNFVAKFLTSRKFGTRRNIKNGPFASPREKDGKRCLEIQG